MNNLNERQQAPSTVIEVMSVTDINGNEMKYVDEGQHGAVDVGVLQEVDNGGEPAEMALIRQVPCRPPETFILTDAVAETYDVDASYNDVV